MSRLDVVFQWLVTPDREVWVRVLDGCSWVEHITLQCLFPFWRVNGCVQLSGKCDEILGVNISLT